MFNSYKDIEFIYLDGGSVLFHRNSPDKDHIANELGFDPKNYDEIVMAVVATQTPEEGEAFWHINTLEKEYEVINRFHVKMCEYLKKPYTQELITKLTEFRIKADFSLKPGVPEALKRLNSKYKLGVLSNALPSRKHFELKLENIDTYFDPIILSFEEGFQKPSLEIYNIAIEESGIDSKKILFVDDKISFLDGAKQAGIGCLILHTSAKNHTEAKNGTLYHSVNNLLELCELLEV